ncbi:MAG: hypothetical protein MUF40_00245 [Gemmatimonadaceae bacterium]|jgi:hypothetical protein|nr:hypothetical protein [Gemmatimonadaceae bacterium]
MSRTRAAGRRLLVAAALGAGPIALGAQQRDSAVSPRDSARAGAPRPAPVGAVRPDTAARPRVVRSRDPLLDPPIAPGRAFLRSFTAPGWGQFRLGRTKSGLVFSAVEIGTIVWGVKAWRDLSAAKDARRDSVPVAGSNPPTFESAANEALINARKLHFEDALALLIANHLLAGADAFVAAHLWDLPARVSIRAMPRGGTALVASFRW